jgi:hypothetical protein
MERFIPLTAQAISATATTTTSQTETVTESAPKPVTEPKPTKTPASPYKGQPLGETPKIQVPADLDLRAV